MTATENAKPYRADWRSEEPDLYPPRGCIDLHRLAWEFIRRHPDYALHAKQMLRLVETGEYATRIQRKLDSCLDGVECWPAANPGETAKAYYTRMKEEKKAKRLRIDRARIDRPRNSFLNLWGLEQPVDPSTPYDANIIKFIDLQVKLKRPQQLNAKSFNLFLYRNEVALRFRVDMPMDTQIELAKIRLKEEASKYTAAVKTSKQDSKSKRDLGAHSELSAEALLDARYWLKCYDADEAPQEFTGNPDKKRELKSGENARLTVINQELKKAGRPIIAKGKVRSFLTNARNHIDGAIFWRLLAPDAESKMRTKAAD